MRIGHSHRTMKNTPFKEYQQYPINFSHQFIQPLVIKSTRYHSICCWTEERPGSPASGPGLVWALLTVPTWKPAHKPVH